MFSDLCTNEVAKTTPVVKVRLSSVPEPLSSRLNSTLFKTKQALKRSDGDGERTSKADTYPVLTVDRKWMDGTDR